MWKIVVIAIIITTVINSISVSRSARKNLGIEEEERQCEGVHNYYKDLQ